MADRDAQLAYFRTRRSLATAAAKSLGLALDPRVCARRVREEAAGGWASMKKSVPEPFSICGQRRATRRGRRDEIGCLLDEPLTRRVWRYENTVRVCEFHKQALRRDYRGRHVNDSNISKNDETPARCFEAAPEVCGAVRAGPRCARSLGRCFEVSCANGHVDVVVHARCWHRNCVEEDEERVYGPLLSRLATEEGFDDDEGLTKNGDAARSSEARSSSSPGDGLPDPTPGPFSTFATTEEPATAARRRACAMWVTKFPKCPVAGCRAHVCKATYFSDHPEPSALDPVVADCDD